MPKFMVEIPHSEDLYECARAIKVFMESGSHFLVNADWGCEDGVHKGWIVIEAENHEQARCVVPPAFRDGAMVTLISRFEMRELDQSMKAHHKEM